MWEREYEELLIQHDAEKLAIPEKRLQQILVQLDEIGEAADMVDRVAAILTRLANGGVYAHITYDAHAGAYVFIKHDGTRSSHTPAQLDALFGAPPARPEPPALRLVG